MMGMRTKSSAPAAASAFAKAKEPALAESQWEMRPGGMLVQQRGSGVGAASPPVPVVRVKVKYGATCHEIYISSQASFGELKKLLAERTGLHAGDQKIMFKDRERYSSSFLDTAGVKDGSKMVLLEDPAAQAKRCLEMRRNARMEKAAKSISRISLEVDRLASQVSALEAIVSKSGKVVESDVINLTETLMNQLLKLDGIIAADEDLKLQRRMQERRVQRCVETLDLLKIKNSAQPPPPQPQQQKQNNQKQAMPAPVVVTTNWVVFDSLFSPSTAGSNSATATTTNCSSAPMPRFEWKLL